MDTTQFILICVASVLLFLFVFFFVWFCYVANLVKKRKAELQNSYGTQQSGSPSSNPNRTTLAEDEVALAKMEAGLLAWGSDNQTEEGIPMQNMQATPSKPVTTVPEEDLISPTRTTTFIEEGKKREVFTNPLFREKRASQLLETNASNTYVPSFSPSKGIVSQPSKKLVDSRRRAAHGVRYPGSDVIISAVQYKEWYIADPKYIPVNYTAPSVNSDEGADPGIVSVLNGVIKFNCIDMGTKPPVNRISHLGLYAVNDGLPRNPHGRTGISGRGLLRRWGPNHAVDPIITRWALTSSGDVLYRGGKRVLEVAVLRREHGVSFPGGFVAANVSLIETLKRELAEEALAALEGQTEKQYELIDKLNDLFQNGVEIFRGIVSDTRNTDNAWIESVVMAYHDNKHILPSFSSNAGLVGKATWVMLSKEVQLTSGHLDWLQEVARMHDAFWTDKMMEATVSLPHNDFITPNLMFEGTVPGQGRGDATLAGGLLSPAPRLSNSDGLMQVSPGYDQVTFAELESILKSKLSPQKKASPTPSDSTVAAPSTRYTSRHRFSQHGGSSPAPAFTLEGMPPPPQKNVPASSQPEAIRKASRKSSDASPVKMPPPSSPPPVSPPPLSPPVVVSPPVSPTSSSSNIKPAELDQKTTPPLSNKRTNVIGSFPALYMGSVSTTNSGGEDVVAACIKTVKANPKPELVSVQLHVTAEGIDIETFNEEKPDEKPRLLKAVPIREISFTSVDRANKRLFAFISSDAASQMLYCHVFLCKAKAKPVAEAVGEAFKAAQAIRVDPFAIKRETEATPEAVVGVFAEKQVPREIMKAQMIIGHGQYGKVFLAESQEPHPLIPHANTRLAVKLMKADASQVDAQDFLQEASVLLQFDHKNIVKVLGVCTARKPWLIVTEFIDYKDLGLVLRHCLNLECFVRPNEWLAITAQVVDALIYLTEKRFVHRDIAARNILLGKNNTAKLGDFGLARKIPEGQDFWKLDRAGKLPVKYMSIETLTTKKFSQASEVWAFGVFIWELLSYAESPFDREGIDNTEIKNKVAQGFRLPQPAFVYYTDNPAERDAARKQCDALYAVCRDTWEASPAMRPTFVQLKTRLHELQTGMQKLFPAPRDVGLMCYNALEEARAKKGAKHGGSLIRAVKSVKDKKGAKKGSVPFNDHDA